MRNVLGAAGAAAMLITPAVAFGAQPVPSAGDLYSLNAGGGSLAPVAGRPGQYDLVLTGVRTAVRLSGEGPRRPSLTAPVALVRGWRALGFAARPPLAALVVPGRAASNEIAIARLSRPRAVPGGVGFRARVVKTRPAGQLTSFIRRAGRPPAGAFGSASLLIDATQTFTVSVEIIVSGLAQANGFVQIKFTNGALLNVGLDGGQLLTQATTPDQIGGLATVSAGPDNTAAGAVSVAMPLAGPAGPGNGIVFSGTAYFPPGVTATADIGGAGAPQAIPAGSFSLNLQAP